MKLAELRAKVIETGRPHYVSEDRPYHVAFMHASNEAAVKSEHANQALGYVVWTEDREGFTITVIDLRPAMLDLRQKRGEPMIVTERGAQQMSLVAEGDVVRVDQSFVSERAGHCVQYVAVYSDGYVDPIAYLPEHSAAEYLRSA